MGSFLGGIQDQDVAPSRTPSLADLAQEDLVTFCKTQGDHGLLRAQQLGRHSPTAGRNELCHGGCILHTPAVPAPSHP